MAQLTDAQLKALADADFNNNTSGDITPAKLRDYVKSLVDSKQQLAKQLTTAQINALTPNLGQIEFNTDLGSYMYYNGTDWVVIRSYAAASVACACLRLVQDGWQSGAVLPVASGANSVAIMEAAIASGAASFVAGVAAVGSGDNSICIGEGAKATKLNATALGNFVEADSEDSLATGYRSKTSRNFEHAHSSGRFATNGDCQFIRLQARNTTTNNTATNVFLDGASSRIIIQNDSLLAGTIRITGLETNGTKVAHYVRQFAIKNVGGTTTLANVQTIGTDYEDDAAWDVTITADDTNDALDIKVTGKGGDTVRWNCVIEANETKF